MIKLVIFDWNGTILADAQAALKACNERSKLFGLAPQTKAAWQAIFEVPIINFYAKFGVSAKDFSAKSDLAAATFSKYFEPGSIQARSRRGVKRTLQALQNSGIQRIILSNHNLDHLNFQLKRLGLGGYFNAVLGNQKQQDNHFKGKEQRLKDYKQSQHLQPEEVIIIGDTAEEIVIGKSFGFTTVGLSGGYNSLKRLGEAQPDYLVHKLPDLIKIIESIDKTAKLM